MEDLLMIFRRSMSHPMAAGRLAMHARRTAMSRSAAGSRAQSWPTACSTRRSLVQSLRASISTIYAATGHAAIRPISSRWTVARTFGGDWVRTNSAMLGARATRDIRMPSTPFAMLAVTWPIAASATTRDTGSTDGGRYDGSITLPDGRDLAATMVADGFAVVYLP